MDRRISKGEIKLSIVMPVYNTEKYFKRSLESVLKQTYKNLEVIVVDDCSPGNIKELVQQYIDKDSRVKLVSHEKNKGLFQARMSGAALATGDFIAFIDSDDYVSCDFYHTLLEAALSKEADIAIGKTVFQNEDGYKYIRNYHDACFEFDKIQGEEVRNRFFSQKGLCYSWHTIWNKIYSKKLWNQCYPYYEKIQSHVIMTEDIAYSTVLFYFANAVTTVENDAYFYCANENASTNTDKVTYSKFEKNMSDIKTVFDFAENFLKEVSAEQEIQDNFHEFRKYYARLWRHMPMYLMQGADSKKGFEVVKEFCPDEEECLTKDDSFFETITTEWRGGLESFKDKIAESKDQYVSFDIFDTLINRPFYEPTDLFRLMDKDFEGLVDPTLDFKKIRMESEAYARNKYGKLHPEWEDITIDDIYDSMSEYYGISKDITDKLRERERELELQFCGTRKAGKELFEVAKLIGKKILIVSDMYLDMEIIENILQKNGYEGYEKLYLSSELHLTKNTGHIFEYVKKDLGIGVKQHIYHFGDTWQNDYINAEKAGFNPLFLPKAKEVFENMIQGVETNACANIGDNVTGIIVNKEEMQKSIGLGCMKSMVYNKYFDNPYRSFNKETDFNLDPNFIGYYALGMHMVGLATWVIEEGKKRNIDTIHFLARDGYLLMKAYDILTEGRTDLPKSNYLYASRKSVMSGMVRSKQGFYNLPVEFRNHSPKTLMKILKFAYAEREEKELKQLIEKAGFNYNKVFTEQKEYHDFINFFLKELYNEDILKKNQRLAGSYYSVIQENDIAFDMGYSGRIQEAISYLVGRGVDVLFVHSDNNTSPKMQRIGKYSITNYYDFIPYVSGLLREHLLSDFGASCSGFKEENGMVKMLMETEEKCYPDMFIIETIQRSALEFVADFRELFKDYLEYIPFRVNEVSMPFEGFIRNSKYYDRKIFSSSYFEDMVYGASSQINIEEFINHTIPYMEYQPGVEQKNLVQTLEGRSLVTKALICFLMDKALFKEIIRIKLLRHPKLFRVARRLLRLKR